MLISKKVVLIDALVLLSVAALAAWWWFLYPIAKAQATEVESYHQTGLSYSEHEYFDVDCTQAKYQGKPWITKLETSRTINYWAAKARNADNAKQEYKIAGKHKLRSIASNDAERYWTTVSFLKMELECYEIASMKDSKPY